MKIVILASILLKADSTFAFKNTEKDTVMVVLMDFKNPELLPEIKSKIESFYKTHVKFIKKELPLNAYIHSIDRYDANKVISYLDGINTSNYKFVVGLTSKDIFTRMGKYPHWGVLGLGTLDNTGCIISTYRMRNTNLLNRTRKVILHEIGHNYGLNHCTSPYPCFMKDADKKISNVDKEPMDMCKVCKSKIPLK